MEALVGLYASSDDDADGSEGGAALPPCKRARTEAAWLGREGLRRPTSLEGRAAWQHELQTHSLDRLQRECAQWPSATSAAERKRHWEWLVGVCSSEFAPELAANRAAGGSGGESGLYMFGSEACDLWVRASDIDCNMWTHARIPKFFARLKKAVTAADPSARVEVIASARVPVAKVCVGGQLFDVTHEFGADNPIAMHHRQVLQWIQQKCRDDSAISIAMRVIKLWAAAKRINNPLRATLNSLGFLVMLLALPLSNPAPPVLLANHPTPAAHTPAPAKAGGEAATDAAESGAESAGYLDGAGGYGQGGERAGGGGGGGEQTTLEACSRAVDLLRAFFQYYDGLGTARCSKVVMAPSGAVRSEGVHLDMQRLSAGVHDPQHNGVGSTLFIQDPFMADINLGRFVDRQSLRRLQAAFRSAHALMSTGSASLCPKTLPAPTAPRSGACAHAEAVVAQGPGDDGRRAEEAETEEEEEEQMWISVFQKLVS
jgi:hypothetical protein